MFRNYYTCPRCGCAWSDFWSCQVDDECPDCALGDISPEDSDDLGDGIIDESELP